MESAIPLLVPVVTALIALAARVSWRRQGWDEWIRNEIRVKRAFAEEFPEDHPCRRALDADVKLGVEYYLHDVEWASAGERLWRSRTVTLGRCALATAALILPFAVIHELARVYDVPEELQAFSTNMSVVLYVTASMFVALAIYSKVQWRRQVRMSVESLEIEEPTSPEEPGDGAPSGGEGPATA